MQKEHTVKRDKTTTKPQERSEAS